MYAIIGATGNTGRVISESLLADGKRVRVVGRSLERLTPLVGKGAEAFVASVTNAQAITEAFRGVKAVYAMVPPNMGAADLRAYQHDVAAALASAVTAAGVEYVVTLSSIGAHLASGVGPVSGLHDMEQRFNALAGVNVLHLRSCVFMENFLFNIELIKSAGLNGTPLAPDLALPMIATRDIAAEASRALSTLEFSGRSVKELLGERDISMREATAIIGTAIGKPDLQYVQFPYEDAEKAMVGAGFSASAARAFVEMYRAMNDGVLVPTERRSAANTTPTRFEEFATQFAAAYAA